MKKENWEELEQQMQEEMQQQLEEEMEVVKQWPIESLPVETLGKIHGSDGELTIFMQRINILPKGGEI